MINFSQSKDFTTLLSATSFEKAIGYWSTIFYLLVLNNAHPVYLRGTKYF
jgi:hypothetical protein